MCETTLPRISVNLRISIRHARHCAVAKELKVRDAIGYQTMSLLYGSGGSGAAGGSMSKAQAMQMERIKVTCTRKYWKLKASASLACLQKDEEIAEQEERLGK